MTIVNKTTVQRAPYRGWDDPRFPVGIWRASVVTVGDASGGLMVAEFTFAEEGDPISGDIYNLEQITAFITDSTTRQGFMRTNNVAPGQGSNFVDRQWRIEFRDSNAAGGGVLADGLPVVPIFLGSRQLGAETPSSLTLSLVNLTAAGSVAAAALGYVWEARSVLAEGGPLRPPNPLFGN